MMKHSLTGPLSIRQLRPDFWCLTGESRAGKAAGADAQAQLYLTGHYSAEDLPGRLIERLDVQWTDGAVTCLVVGNGWTRTLAASAASVHESKPRLYELLPLAGFDGKARRFWRRIFLLMRLPGGRSFLRLIARRRGR